LSKLIRKTILLVLCATLVACSDASSEKAAQTDKPMVEVVEVNIEFPYAADFVINYKDGYLIKYQKESILNTYLCFLDPNFKLVWEHAINTFGNTVTMLGDRGFLIITGSTYNDNGYARLDENGSVLWRIGKIPKFELVTAFLDSSGGVYLVGVDISGYKKTVMIYVNPRGKIEQKEPFAESRKTIPISGWQDSDNTYWISGSNGRGDYRSLSHWDEDLTYKGTFSAKYQQYFRVGYFPEADRVIISGQAYRFTFQDPWVEYGFLYSVNYDLKQKKYLEFDGALPRSIIRLEDGRWLVSIRDNDNLLKDVVKLYSPNWRLIKTIDIDFGYSYLYALDDGGFAITGRLLSPGYEYGDLFVSSFSPSMDLVYARYDADCNLLCGKTYPAEVSKSGKGFCYFVDRAGVLYYL